MRRLLLVSNSTLHGQGYLDHCADEIRSFLGSGVKRVRFVPFALADLDGYTQKARERFARLGYELDGVQSFASAREALEGADAVFVGGGNTFRLLERMQASGVLDAIRARALEGLPYVGSSAGTNVACPTIQTTNDMPIVWPVTPRALGLVPFQVNAHYLDPQPGSTHMGETREERLRQYHEENERVVIGLREGAMLRVEGGEMELRGTTGARIFERGRAPLEVVPVAKLERYLSV